MSEAAAGRMHEPEEPHGVTVPTPHHVINYLMIFYLLVALTILTVLVAMGHHVTGSDLKSSPGVERLRALGVEVFVGHRADQVGDVDAVTFSTAVPAANPEVAAARARGIPVLRRAETLAAITAVRRTVAVAGTHGKTTTTSMLALILDEAGMSPSYIVGGELNEIGGGALWSDAGDLFVVEADESDGTFLEPGAEAVVVNNVEPDHLDYYGSLAAIEATFDRFLDAPGVKVVGADDPIAAALGRAHGALQYGTSEHADLRIVDHSTERAGATFRLARGGERGQHRHQNAVKWLRGHAVAPRSDKNAATRQ